MTNTTVRIDIQTHSQWLVLAQEPRLWPASILQDGSVLCLDRDRQRAGGSAQDDEWTPTPWVLTKTGSLLSVYHYYAKHHGFTYLDPKQRDEPSDAPVPLELKRYLTILEVIDYLAATYGIERSKSTITRWLHRELVASKLETVAGRRARFVSRSSLDAYVLCSRMRQPGNNRRVTALPPGTTCDRSTAEEANLCPVHK